MKKSLFLSIILSFLLCTVALADETATLTISGAGVSSEITISIAELEAMEQMQVAYTTSNNYPTSKIIYAEGVSLDYLLSVKSNAATQLKFISSDGYYKTFTVKELLEESRYTYVNGIQSDAPAMIALKTSEDGFLNLEKTEPVLMMGQRAENEQTNPWFVKYLSNIEVLTDITTKWDKPMIDPSSCTLKAGSELSVSYKNMDSVKIYYTTDGTNPTYNSTMYNPSTTYFQPKLIKPISINETTTIKLMAVGVGKENSDIATYTYTAVDDGFSDMAGYEWADEAVAKLAEKGIISGIGDNKYDPSGNLTRAAMSKVMVLLLGADETAYQGGFFDVKSSAWYSGYVQTAVDMGIFKGMGDGKFAPDDVVTKEQMIMLLVRALGYGDKIAYYENDNKLTGDISSWARGAVELAYKLNMIEIGNIATEINGAVTFEGKSPASRADVAVTVVMSKIVD